MFVGELKNAGEDTVFCMSAEFSDLMVISLSAVSMQVTLSGDGTLCLESTVR